MDSGDDASTETSKKQWGATDAAGAAAADAAGAATAAPVLAGPAAADAAPTDLEAILAGLASLGVNPREAAANLQSMAPCQREAAEAAAVTELETFKSLTPAEPRGLFEVVQVALDTQWVTPSQGAVQEALTDATVVPIGNDPSTKFGGLFGPEALDVLTAAHSAESSINMLMLASGLPEDKVRELLRAWTSNALDVLRSKPSGQDRPAIAQLRSDSKVMVKKLIKLVMSKPDKTVVALFCGWLPDLLLQWGFNTADIKYQARVRLDGTNGLADHGVQHSSGDIGDVISSRMMPAACAHRHLKLPHARGPRPRPTHEPLPLTAACSLSPLLVCCVCQSQARP